jgi:hypothetical protein
MIPHRLLFWTLPINHRIITHNVIHRMCLIHVIVYVYDIRYRRLLWMINKKDRFSFFLFWFFVFFLFFLIFLFHDLKVVIKTNQGWKTPWLNYWILMKNMIFVFIRSIQLPNNVYEICQSLLELNCELNWWGTLTNERCTPIEIYIL